MRFSNYRFTTVTISGATFTCNNHELKENDTIVLGTTGALPTGIAADTTYYVVKDAITDNTFEISASKGGDSITTTGGAGTGAHSFIKTNGPRLKANVEDNH